MGEERLEGGNVSEVVRLGDTVRRPWQPWSAAVQALLRHLEAAGFTGAPRALGRDAQGREVLQFVSGDVPCYPLPPYARTDGALLDAAHLLRDYHEATRGFVPPAGAMWHGAASGPAEVVCHNDLAPYNTVYVGGRPVAWIDFDSAAPGPRLWDVVHAAYRFVPLEGEARAAAQWPDNRRRLRLFADAYGLNTAERGAFADTLVQRVEAMADWLRRGAADPGSAQARLVRGGHLAYYEREAPALLAVRADLRAALLEGG